MIVIENIDTEIAVIAAIILIITKKVESTVQGIVMKRRRKNIKSVGIDLLRILVPDYLSQYHFINIIAS